MMLAVLATMRDRSAPHWVARPPPSLYADGVGGVRGRSLPTLVTKDDDVAGPPHEDRSPESGMRLDDLLSASAKTFGGRAAVVDRGGTATYGELDALVNRIGHALLERGVRRGDRVGVWLDKSVKAIASMQAALRVGAAFVPLDPQSPPARVARIVKDCGIGVAVADRKRSALLAELGVASIVTELAQGVSWPELASFDDGRLERSDVSSDDLAYVLYTSGSTGAPKGVCMTHANGRAFVDWATREVGLSPEDRLANHAALHFDLSTFDVFGAFAVGAAVCVVPEAMAYLPDKLVRFCAEEQITVWYSVPTALVLMVDRGAMSARELPSLRAILFAGEVYPQKELRRLREAFPDAALYNLYGPTETNVCTFHRLARGSGTSELTAPLPIGRAASGDEVWAVKADGTRCAVGEEGELWVSGPSVMHGYWGKDPLTGPYRTGDIVRIVEDEPPVFTFVGRTDRLVKANGYRIELGDVEAALLEHGAVREVAVVVRGTGNLARLVAYVVAASDPAPSLLGLKKHSAERLPRYMILDELIVLPTLPRTPNGKIDYERLRSNTDERA